MTRSDVVKNIVANYRQYGISEANICDSIASGEKQGFSYNTIYTGLRMALSSTYGTEEFFSPEEIAEAMGTSEEEVIKEIEFLRASAIARDEDPDKYCKKITSGQKYSYILPAGFTRK